MNKKQRACMWLGIILIGSGIVGPFLVDKPFYRWIFTVMFLMGLVTVSYKDPVWIDMHKNMNKKQRACMWFGIILVWIGGAGLFVDKSFYRWIFLMALIIGGSLIAYRSRRGKRPPPLYDMGNQLYEIARKLSELNSETLRIGTLDIIGKKHEIEDGMRYIEDAIHKTEDAVLYIRHKNSYENPDFAEAHCGLGVAEGKLGHWQDAVYAFKHAIKVKPDFFEAHYNRGIAYGNLGRYQEAIAAYKQAIRIKPDYAESYFNLGIAYLVIGDNGSAEEEYKILKTLDAKRGSELTLLINKWYVDLQS